MQNEWNINMHLNFYLKNLHKGKIRLVNEVCDVKNYYAKLIQIGNDLNNLNDI